jgi:uncharacterized delta-60 repeat protein
MRYLQRLGGVAVGAVLIMAAPVLAAPGDLDPSFGGGDGMKTNDFGGDDNGRGIVTLSNGKIVQVGDSDAGGDDDDFAIARYKPNGSRDTTFGGDGRVTTNFFDNHDTAWTVARYGDNKVVVAGWAENAAGDDFHFALARYRSGGGLDTTFGGDGRVVTPFPHEGYVYDILVLPNGSILAVGEDYEDPVDDFALAMYKPNGRLDRSFSGDGKRTTDFEGGGDGGWSVLRQGDRLLVSGWGQDGPEPNDYDVALARYRMNGSLDDSFSGDGKKLIDATSIGGYAVGMVPVENGRILILVTSEGDVGLVRINPGGSPDSTFGGGDGEIVRDFGGSERPRNVVRTGTKLVVGGEADEEQAVWRFRQNGRKDLGFGSDGQALSDYPVSAYADGITRRGDRVVVSGSTDDGDMAVSRFLLD